MNKACVIAHEALYYFVRAFPADHDSEEKRNMREIFIKAMDELERLYEELEAEKHRVHTRDFPDIPCECGHCNTNYTESVKTVVREEISEKTGEPLKNEIVEEPMTNTILLG